MTSCGILFQSTLMNLSLFTPLGLLLYVSVHLFVAVEWSYNWCWFLHWKHIPSLFILRKFPNELQVDFENTFTNLYFLWTNFSIFNSLRHRNLANWDVYCNTFKNLYCNIFFGQIFLQQYYLINPGSFSLSLFNSLRTETFKAGWAVYCFWSPGTSFWCDLCILPFASWTWMFSLKI